jgi:molybdopterin/thiamine biosynthesis adenylyltransferase
MNELYRAIFSRNLGLLSEAEQEMIHNSTIAIAGLGGIGGLAAERLIRIGVGGLRITDPCDFEVSNLNRQFGASLDNLGRNKTEVILEQLSNINPQAKIEFSKAGIVPGDNISKFIHGCKIVIDAMDFGMLKESILLQRAARRTGMHYLFSTALGFGAMTVVFTPDGITLEEYNNLSRDVDLNGSELLTIPMDNVIPVIPGYVKNMNLLSEIYAGKIPVPSNSIGAGLAAIQAASEAVNVIIGRDIPVAPQYTYLDLVDRRMVVGNRIQLAGKI